MQLVSLSTSTTINIVEKVEKIIVVDDRNTDKVVDNDAGILINSIHTIFLDVCGSVRQ